MKITHKGPADTDVSQLVQNDKTVHPSRREGTAKAPQVSESAKVNISPQARELQRIAELARKGDELRADKVQNVKEQIETGEFHADSVEVSRSILRSEVARLLEKE